MSDAFIGEVRLLPYTFAPMGWMSCNGQILAIRSNTALFSILGITYGGDGINTFGIPNLNGRAVPGAGNGPGLSPHPLGEADGESSITLTTGEIPSHTHTLQGAAVGTNTSTAVSGNMFGQGGRGASPYAAFDPATLKTTTPASLQPVGGTMPHDNMQPYLVAQYCIATQGIFPPRS